MGLLHGIGGSLWAAGWFVFFDGLILSKRAPIDQPYNFVCWLPGIFCCLTMFILFFVKPETVSGGDDDGDMMGMGGSTDEGAIQRAKGLFFFATSLGLAGFAVAIWMMSTNYKTSANSWPGVALMLQTCLLLSCCGCIFVARKKKSDDGFGF